MTEERLTEPKRRPRILILAYACNPYIGSEGGAGWAMVMAIAQIADVVVMVPPREWTSIKKWMAEHRNDNLRFVLVPHLKKDYPLIRFLEKIERKTEFLSYFEWLRSAKRTALRLEAEAPFDATVHASFGCYWLPTPLCHLKAPVLWGPVGGAMRTPWQLWTYLGFLGFFYEWKKIVILKLASWLPVTRRTWRQVTIRIAETENTRDVFPAALRRDTRVISRGPLASVPDLESRPRKSYLLFPSYLEPRKGPRLALRALAYTPSSVRLVFVSDGYELEALKRLARRLNVEDRVDFLGRIPRQDMFKMMAETAGVVFTGLREGGCMAIVESMLIGAPVIVLGIGGTLELARLNTDPSRIRIIEPTSATETARRLGEAMAEFSTNPPQATGCYLDYEPTVRNLHRAVQDVIVAKV